MKGETILQFHGIGPYDITYVNAADDLVRLFAPFAALSSASFSTSPRFPSNDGLPFVSRKAVSGH